MTTFDWITAFIQAHEHCDAPEPSPGNDAPGYYLRAGAARLAIAGVGAGLASCVAWCPACDVAVCRTCHRDEWLELAERVVLPPVCGLTWWASDVVRH